MNLLSILKNVKVEGAFPEDVTIQKICFDSRLVQPNDLFVAVRGVSVDGHNYIDKAIENGSKVIVCETLPASRVENVIYVQTADTAEALGIMASNYYGNPSRDIKLVGITGTNGKTTIATLLYQLFRKLGFKVGLLSTICNYVDDRAVPSTHTTPDALELNELLAEMRDAGCEYAFMECSSHAIEQRRIAGLHFEGGVFTNLTRDHMDYHKTVENYLKAKKRFFDDLPSSAFALTNADDKNGLVMTQNTKAQVKTYSTRTLANFKTRILESSFEGMLLEINGREISVPFVGKFNASNLSAVFGAAVLLGYSEDEIALHLSMLHPVSGRFEAITSPDGIIAIVDYAHTPDALSNVLSTINDIREGKGTLITVVGAGGNRDKGKRPMMAAEAVKASDKVILTSDNPRDEEPQDILNDMLEGVSPHDKRKVLVIVDRREAIRTACSLAKAGDVILVAGKGHENYQIVKGVKSHFDDHEIVKESFNL